MKSNHHSLPRQLIDLRIAHADLDARIDHGAREAAPDEFSLRRLKKRRLALRDAIDRLERALQPQEPA
ncbi:YdcH family protein [Acidovorax soli]|uniref:YdcH family protein n=1 Tax=Acidovorax TaxID=12916 RepID=UPI0026EF00F4|nr:YdcH family protein [Acidovorax soli]MCM2346573.1 YdcH family protein [Acidovorax soli]